MCSTFHLFPLRQQITGFATPLGPFTLTAATATEIMDCIGPYGVTFAVAAGLHVNTSIRSNVIHSSVAVVVAIVAVSVNRAFERHLTVPSKTRKLETMFSLSFLLYATWSKTIWEKTVTWDDVFVFHSFHSQNSDTLNQMTTPLTAGNQPFTLW